MEHKGNSGNKGIGGIFISIGGVVTLGLWLLGAFSGLSGMGLIPGLIILYAPYMAAVAIAMFIGDNTNNSILGYFGVGYSVIATIIAVNVGVLNGFWRSVGIGFACFFVMTIVSGLVGGILGSVVRKSKESKSKN